MGDFWEQIETIDFDNSASEGDVEARLVLPMLRALDYDQNQDLTSKVSVEFVKGTSKEIKKADFVAYYGPIKTNNTSLIVVEAKRTSENLINAKGQAASYAHAIRAPLYVVTNGKKIEVWQLQLSTECTLALEYNVCELAAHRGTIESLLAKEAARSLCQRLNIKDMKIAAGDATAYIEAEARRAATSEPFISRTLSRGRDQPPLASKAILEEYPRGALILGASGFGKTELQKFLFRDQLGRAAADQDQQLPFDISLPDLAASSHSIQKYVEDRISAHCPSFTPAKLKDELRAKGAVVLCDGYERVPAHARQRLAVEAASLQRDYPKIAIFIFSRASAAESVSLPLLELLEFDVHQQREFEAAHLPGKNHSISWDLTDAVRDRLAHPIFLKLLCEHYAKFGSAPKTLTALFEEWFSRALDWSDPSPAVRMQRERALSLLAERTLNTPISKIQAFEVLQQGGFGDEVFNALVASQALNISANTVELVHEALADFVRAKCLAALPFDRFEASLAETVFRNDSLLGALLMGLLQETARQRAVWRRLSQSGIRTYLGAFKFRADVSSELRKLSEGDAQTAILQDIRDGFEETGRAFFSELWDEICVEEIGDCDVPVAITGKLSEGLKDISYSLHPSRRNGALVQIGRANNAKYRRYINLELSRKSPDAGRTVGVQILRDALEKILKQRRLKGGLALARERSISRIRFLVEEYEFPARIGKIEEIFSTLSSRQKDYIDVGDQSFFLFEVMDDLKVCFHNGDRSIDRWWKKYTDKQGNLKSDCVSQALIETYERAELILGEIFSASFATICQEMDGSGIRPIQWRLRVNHAGDGAWPFQESWFPVENSKSPKATVEVVSEPKKVFFTERMSHYEEVRSELIRLRRRSDARVSIMSSHLPEFWGYSGGRFTGETPTLTMVHNWILDELKDIFSDFPSGF